MLKPLVIAVNAGLECALLPSLANRHSCIMDATGTGKTVAMLTIAQALFGIGVLGSILGR